MWQYARVGGWRIGHQLTKRVYEITHAFPRDERFGLTGQLRRAAMSIPVNVAEGAGRSTTKDYAHYLSIAIGSANEAEYLLLLAYELGYLDSESHAELHSLP